jgi:hypothetical protein
VASQEPKKVNVSVSVGITTIIGWLTAVGGLIPILVKLLEEGQKGLTLAGPEKWFAIIGVVSLGITQIGRYVQSVVVAQHASVAAYAPAVAQAAASQPVPVSLQLVQAAPNGQPAAGVPEPH